MAGAYDPAIHRRRSVCLTSYDYAAAGAYFLTLCAKGRYHLFGEIVGGEMLLNDVGLIVREEWARTPHVRREVTLDAAVVMPNHLHGIVLIDTDRPTGTRTSAPRRGRMPPSHFVGPHPTTPSPVQPGYAQPGRMPDAPTMRSPAQTVGSLVRGFKAAVTRRVGALCGTPDVRVWQRNYCEHIIRDDRDLDRIRAYIADNPLRWAEDDYNTEDRP